MSTSLIQTCRRCGQCCANGGPAIHTQDTTSFGEDGLAMEDLITLRTGELVHDQPTGEVIKLEAEMVKIREGEVGTACRFYGPADKSCAIYPKRPAECRALECADPEPLKEMYEKDRLSRRDLLPEGHPLLELLDAHDENCSPQRLADLCKAVLEAGDKEAVNAIGEMITYDETIRAQVAEKAGVSPEAMHFLFGRPIPTMLAGLGLRMEQTGDNFKLIPNPLTRNS